MAGPLSGIVGNQQIASAQAAQTQQQNAQNNSAVRPENQQPEENQVQPQGAAAAETQDSATNNDNAFQQRIEQLINPLVNGGDTSDVPRGALVDVVV